MYQPPSTQQPTHQSFIQHPHLPQQTNHHQISQSPQTIPTQQFPQQPTLQQPNIYQGQNINDPNRSLQQPLPPAKFDPYRPQPAGAYDIPKPMNPPPPPPQQQQQQQQQQNISPAPRINPQDVYRPGGLLSTNQSQVPSSSINNNNYDPNQFVQYVAPPSQTPPPPPPPPLVPSPTPPPPPPLVPSPSSATHLPKTAVPNQPTIPKIVDDLLSLALEQQIESAAAINTEPNTPEPQPTTSIDEDLHQKSNGKPIACIQPLSMVVEEKQPIQSLSTPVSSLNPPQDPYDDKDKLDQLAADVQRFEKHVSTMTKKILNGTVPLEVEWKVRIC
jgi:hypothetical protein